jgi:heme-degrading monooxygenase HmoA
VTTDRAEEYLQLMQDVVVPDYRQTPGNVAAYTLSRKEDAITHVLMVTCWESLGAVAAFAGEPVEQAKYYDFDSEFLLEFEPTVQHYVLSSGSTDKEP